MPAASRRIPPGLPYTKETKVAMCFDCVAVPNILRCISEDSDDLASSAFTVAKFHCWNLALGKSEDKSDLGEIHTGYIP